MVTFAKILRDSTRAGNLFGLSLGIKSPDWSKNVLKYVAQAKLNLLEQVFVSAVGLNRRLLSHSLPQTRHILIGGHSFVKVLYDSTPVSPI